jgi:predicted Zn-dependent peptidase
MSSILTSTFDSGLTLAIEPSDAHASVSFQWLLPAGSATDAADADGVAALLGEWIFRGAGGMTSREHSDALDRLGVQRHSHVMTHHLGIGGTMVGARFVESLPLLAALVLRPALGDASLDPVRQLSLQSLASLDDEPQLQVMLNVRARHRPAPFNRHGYGAEDVLHSVEASIVRDAWRQRFVPGGSILAVMGAVEPQAVRDAVAEQCETWTRDGATPPANESEPARGYHAETRKTAQVHIGMAYDAPAQSDPHAMLERLATYVLGGATSGRLFTEVRQKRSLSYAVSSSYRAGRDHGLVSIYAGTTQEHASQTMEVILAEVRRMKAGIDEAEFNRAATGLKSHLVMQGESTAARAGAIAADLFKLGAPRTLDDIAAQVDAITLDELNAYLAGRTFGALTCSTIGPDALDGISLDVD